jgi:protein RecA
MERIRKTEESLTSQVQKRADKPLQNKKEYDGNFITIISTGSTLLDLAISGKRVHGGGIPGGIVVEASGPSQSAKTVLLAETAGYVQRKGGEAQFHDPEARLDQEFTAIFGMHIPKKNYYQPDTVTEVFSKVQKWLPKETEGVVNGIFVDSSAALSTNLEMDNEDGDKMGGRRGKEFSEQLRKTCRIIKQKNYLMFFSNQIRDSFASYGPKTTTPGGHAFEFYSSVRLRHGSPEKIYKIVKVAGKEVKKIIGIKVEIEVTKTVDEPYRKADIYVIYGYGIDDVRANLQFIKDFTRPIKIEEPNTKKKVLNAKGEVKEKSNSMYSCCGIPLAVSMDEAIRKVESQGLVNDLKEETITLWETIESKFETERQPKQR